jgi:hypothetical protein
MQMEKDFSIKSDLKGIWAILWRSTLLVAVMLPIGLALLTLAVGTLIVPPIYAVVCLFGENVFLGVLVMVLWIGWLFLARRFYAIVFEGSEYGSI